MKKALPLFFLLCFSLIVTDVLSADTVVVKSPDGKVEIKLYQQHQVLHFWVGFFGKTIIAPSPLYFSVNEISLTHQTVITRPRRYSGHETYTVIGPHARALNTYNGIKIHTAIRSSDVTGNIDIRVFNDGVAFRHEVVTDMKSLTPAEKSIFNLPSGTTVWYHDLNMHYEGVHVKKPIDSLRQGEWAAPPVTFKLPQGVYASITEAALLGYPGMAMQSNGKNGLVITLAEHQPTSYPYKLRYPPEDTSRLRMPSKINGALMTPWRVVVVGKDLNALVNNDIITNLNPPPDPKLFPAGLSSDWIKPGRAVWKYLNGGGEGTLEVMKHFTDGAAALGFEHHILEGFWSRWPEDQLRELVNYSRQKGVGIWLWKHSKSLRNAYSRDSFFRKCRELGIAGAKIDFFDHEAKEVIDLYEAILKEAAQYKVLLDFHGSNKPTGLSRTYPNALVYEGVKGMESSRLADRATHETTVPFTRMLAGPAEYTVVHFGARRANTTWAHQIASAAILSAPLLTYAAHPDTILMNPAVDLIKNIPASWDETIVLPSSEIGEVAIFARRKGNNWFLAVINGTQPREIKVPLSFLVGNYKVVIARDDPADSASVIMENKTSSSGDTVELRLGTGGGYIAMFSK